MYSISASHNANISKLILAILLFPSSLYRIGYSRPSWRGERQRNDGIRGRNGRCQRSQPVPSRLQFLLPRQAPTTPTKTWMRGNPSKIWGNKTATHTYIWGNEKNKKQETHLWGNKKQENTGQIGVPTYVCTTDPITAPLFHT